jgi:hypothetical protein
MRREFLVFFIFLYSASAKSQGFEKLSFFNLTEIGYGAGIGKVKFENLNGSEKNESTYFRLRTQFGYFISTRLSIGMGLGLDGYHENTFNTAPLFTDVRYYVTDRPQTFFVFANTGYAIPLGNNFEKGFMGGIALGRKISRRRLTLLPSVGLHVQQLESVATLKSIQFNFGLMF